jgi:hypothetical protein
LEAFIEWLSTLKSSLDGVPVVDSCFAQLPTEQNDLLPGLEWEIKQALVEILYLDANRIDFLDCILGLLDGGALGHAFVRYSTDIDQHASGEKDILAEHLQFCFDETGTSLGVNRPPQQGFQDRQ